MTDDTALPPAAAQALRDRGYGVSRPGSVDLRSFDEGVVRTLGSEIINDQYWLKVPGVDPAPDKPGIMVTFAYPEDTFEKHVLPAIVVRRDDITAAMQRWHADGIIYTVPGTGARPLSVDIPGQGTKHGWDRVEQKRQLEPVDIMYTVSILCRHRQGPGGRKEANAILMRVLSHYHACASLEVLDDLGDRRNYEVFREGISMLDDLPEVSGRIIGFAITLRVEAELDLAGVTLHRTVKDRNISVEFRQVGED